MTWWLVRHADAGVRGAGPDDAHRPLTEHGRAQALDLVDLLTGAGVGTDAHVVASPAQRCVQTVQPVAEAIGTDGVTEVPWLFEGQGAAAALAALDAYGDDDVVACSHGDVIPAILMALDTRGVTLTDNRCQKASVWRIDTVAGAPTSTTYLPPPGSSG